MTPEGGGGIAVLEHYARAREALVQKRRRRIKIL
jgi:hypothetical protein